MVKKGGEIRTRGRSKEKLAGELKRRREGGGLANGTLAHYCINGNIYGTRGMGNILRKGGRKKE